MNERKTRLIRTLLEASVVGRILGVLIIPFGVFCLMLGVFCLIANLLLLAVLWPVRVLNTCLMAIFGGERS